MPSLFFLLRVLLAVKTVIRPTANDVSLSRLQTLFELRCLGRSLQSYSFNCGLYMSLFAHCKSSITSLLKLALLHQIENNLSQSFNMPRAIRIFDRSNCVIGFVYRSCHGPFFTIISKNTAKCRPNKSPAVTPVCWTVTLFISTSALMDASLNFFNAGNELSFSLRQSQSHYCVVSGPKENIITARLCVHLYCTSTSPPPNELPN